MKDFYYECINTINLEEFLKRVRRTIRDVQEEFSDTEFKENFVFIDHLYLDPIVMNYVSIHEGYDGDWELKPITLIWHTILCIKNLRDWIKEQIDRAPIRIRLYEVHLELLQYMLDYLNYKCSDILDTYLNYYCDSTEFELTVKLNFGSSLYKNNIDNINMSDERVIYNGELVTIKNFTEEIQGIIEEELSNTKLNVTQVTLPREL